MIVNCGKDENGTYTGGQAGDQTKAECYKRAWYNHPWTCLLRHKDSTIADKIAELAEQAAENDLIGYDQNERQTFWTALSACSYEPKNIKTACEADCSSMVSSIIKAVGYLANNALLQNVNPYLTTYYMKSALLAAGFNEVSTSLTSESGAQRGDIWLNESQHTAIQITDGGGTSTVIATTTSLPYMTGKYPLIKPANADTKFNEVSALQALLNLHGYNLTIDGKYGSTTQNAVYLWQSKNALTADKEAGAETWLSLIQKE